MKLLLVPASTSFELCLKLGSNGVTWLRESKFKSRYVGSKRCLVDINGNLWLNASDKKHFEYWETQQYNRPDLLNQKTDSSTERIEKYYLAGAPKKGKKKPVSQNKPANEIISCSVEEVPNYNTAAELPKKLAEKSYTVKKSAVRQRLLAYLNTQKGKKELYFWTVTFPAGTCDDTAYQAFNTWLTSLRQYRMLKDYLWIAERQDGKRLNPADGKQATNTVHFHIAIPHKMPVKRANAMMAGTLKKLAKKGLINCNFDLLRKYNGVDIAKNRKTKRVVNFAIKKGSRSLLTYLTKYVTKNDGKFSHLAWHNSRGFSQLFTAVTLTLPEFEKYGFAKLLDKSRAYDGQYFVFIPWGRGGPPGSLMQHLHNVNSFIQSQLN